jgi:hypothetical protein
MQKQILTELKELQTVIAKLVGSTDFPEQDRFSIEKIEKAAKEFKKLFTERGEWIREYDLDKYFKGVSYGAGAFIRNEFGFSNYFKKGNTCFYNRKDIISLAKELKDRNVNLSNYMEFMADQENFKKKIAIAAANKKAIGKRPYVLPDNVQDIAATDPPRPPVELVRKDLEDLKKEFFEYKLDEYIDIHRDSYTMVKFTYHYDKYYPKELKSRCRKWCEQFNYANYALEMLIGKKSEFIPVKEEDMIEL